MTKLIILSLFLGLIGGLFYDRIFFRAINGNVVYNNQPQTLQVAAALSARAKEQEQQRQFQIRVSKVRAYLIKHDSPLADSAESLVKCSETYGFHYGFLTSISLVESSLGKYYTLRFNPFNWGVHSGRTFASLSEAGCHVAAGIRNTYDTSSTYTIASRYAPRSDGNSPEHWASVVDSTQKEIESIKL